MTGADDWGRFVAIGELYDVVIDCPDPDGLAEFYRQMIGGRIADSDGERTSW
ncbi:hypothetical protein C8D88_104548 [Lentzea atacamensis]|uniref:Glyoxalase-like domain-containing protein n=1 Tax=Lentzea atacamensis TaxID=531938 RepID=A0A316I4Q1_9PSEU|nr:VOC family protein [Lentzea atacamensis]PWK87387.1 hypothetical protein C8D88_104548 [Lentzea atacamensis]